jgi:hypothetical protein
VIVHHQSDSAWIAMQLMCISVRAGLLGFGRSRFDLIGRLSVLSGDEDTFAWQRIVTTTNTTVI